MKQQLIKPIVRIGNSSGVVLPKEWLNKKARIELIQESFSDIIKNIFKILEENSLLQDTIGIYLCGSYARDEQRDDSDVDLLVITSNINKRIKKDVYDVTLISKDNVEKSLKNQILPILPMLKEAKPILNKDLLENYKRTPLTKKNLRWHIETTKSAIKMNKYHIKLSEELSEKDAGDAVAYSLVLRIREALIIDSLRKNKISSKKELIDVIKKVAGSDSAYKGYIYSKENPSKQMKNILPIEEAKKLLSYLENKIKEQEKWLREKKD